MVKRTFFDHTPAGIINALHDYKGIGVYFFNFRGKPADLQPGYYRKNDISSSKAFTSFPEAFFPGIYREPTTHFILDKISNIGTIG